MQERPKTIDRRTLIAGALALVVAPRVHAEGLSAVDQKFILRRDAVRKELQRSYDYLDGVITRGHQVPPQHTKITERALEQLVALRASYGAALSHLAGIETKLQASAAESDIQQLLQSFDAVLRSIQLLQKQTDATPEVELYCSFAASPVHKKHERHNERRRSRRVLLTRK